MLSSSRGNIDLAHPGSFGFRGLAMPKHKGSVGVFLHACAFLFLGLSVFCFGLYTRLEAYKAMPSNIANSKMSTEKHSAESLKALEMQESLPDHLHALVLGFLLPAYDLKIAPPPSELARIELADIQRLNLGSVYSLHGPPLTIL